MNLVPEQRIEEYILIESLSEYSNVWQAYDENSQREVVLKFVENRISADREGIVLADMDHPNILKLLRRFDYMGMAVLVFEHIPGIRLDKAIRKGLTREEAYKICIDICSALKSVHQFGLFHGDLSPFNVIWSESKNKAYLIDFGATGGCTVLSAAPEHDPESRIPLGPYTDMVGFGRILMSLFPKLKSLYERCLQDAPELRPTAAEALNLLVKSRDTGKIVGRGIILAAMFILSVWFFYAISTRGSEEGLEQKIQALSETADEQSLAELRNILFHPDNVSNRDRIVREIADLNDRLGKETVVASTTDDILAVFAFDIDPMVVFEDGYVQLGDRLSIGNDNGHVREINRGNIIIKTANGSKEIHYRKPTVFDWVTIEYQPVSIFPGKFNLDIVFAAICEITGRNFLGNPGRGVISGGFDAESYEAFLDSLGDRIYFDDYNLRVRTNRFPISIAGGEEHWFKARISLAEVLDLYSPLIGYRCIYLGHNTDTDFWYPFLQFDELLEVMELDYVINDEEILIYDKGGNNDQG